MRDEWWRLLRVDVKGYPVHVRGDEARRHLEQFDREFAKMKLALHKIAQCESYAPGDVVDIARKAISKD